MGTVDRVTSRFLADFPEPREDPFYDTDGDVADRRPGEILGYRAIEVRGSAFPPNADAWQVRFRTNDTAGTPVTATATVLVPRRRDRSGIRKLVSYQCAIDSLTPRVDPSYTLRRGNQRELPFIRLALWRGWAVVTTDYTGPRRAYAAGTVAGRHVLDGIRAALALKPAGLDAQTPVGLWGYSGGGQASAWAAELQPTYAPELNIAMVAAGRVPPDIHAVALRSDGTFFSGLAFGGALGISREHPEFDLPGLLTAEGLAELDRAQDMAVNDLLAAFPFRRLRDLSRVADPLAEPSVRELLGHNDLGNAIPTAPLYFYHSIYDQIIPIADVDALVAHYRNAGVDIRYRRSRIGEHCLLVVTGAFGALRALQIGFARAEQVDRSTDNPVSTVAV